VIAALGWLVFGVAGDRSRLQPLPDTAGSTVAWLADAGKTRSPSDVAAARPEAWRPWDGRGYIRAAPGEAVWVRVLLRNPAGEPRHGVLAGGNHFSDRVDAWFLTQDGAWRQASAGKTVAVRNKPVWTRLAAFPVDVPAGGEQVVYLRAEDFYGVHLRPEWWPKMEDFFAMQVRDVLAESVCYGGVLALLLYNAVLWVRLRFPDSRHYVAYAGTMTVFNLVASGAAGLLGLAAGSPWKEMIAVSALALSGASLVQFARVFLGTAERLPRGDRLLRWLRVGLVALALGVAAAPWLDGLGWRNAAIAAVAATHLILLAVAVASWRAGARQARFFLAAFGLLFAGVLPAVLAGLGEDIPVWSIRSVLMGSTLEMLMLSLAVADRFAQTQRKLVEETEQRRMIEAAYADELEIEVRERTRELRDANADKDRILAVIGHDLRGPLTALLRTAERTAGDFARETAATGRTLSLMIEDLVLWARLRAGTCALAGHPATALAEPAAALYRTLAETGGIELRIDVPADLSVETDLVLAQTLLRNLLANALKFARTRVELRATVAAGGVLFAVGNDGPPLPPEVAARFAAGQDEPMTATGGLGLRLCREICHALGTQLAAASPTVGGTEFSFTLPAARPVEVPA